MKIDKYYLNLAGEYRVSSELLKRGVFATVTYGNKKGAYIYAIGTNRRAAVIEVKASNSLRFVTSFYQKYKTIDKEHPTFWVLYSVRESQGEFSERFFVLTHEEMAEAQAERNHHETLSWEERAAELVRGVDNVVAKNVEQHEIRWDKIVDYCNDPM